MGMSITKQTFRAGPFQGVFAQGARVGDLLYLAGQVSMDDEGNVPGSGDIGKQLEQCYANVGSVLSEFGGDVRNIIDETIFVTDISQILNNLDTFSAVRESVYGAAPEVSQTLVEVAGLVTPDLLVELKCVAHLVSFFQRAGTTAHSTQSGVQTRLALDGRISAENSLVEFDAESGLVRQYEKSVFDSVLALPHDRLIDGGFVDL